ncbi:MAG: type II CAAX endopeptidase family protein [bacterium]
MRAWLRRYRVPLFLAATYGWTWAVGVPAALAAHGIGHTHRSGGAITLAGFSPSIVALALLLATDGRAGIGTVWRQVWRAEWRRWWRWYLLAWLGPIILTGLSLLVLPAVGQPLPTLGPWYSPLLGTLVLVPLTGFFEEVGWRGFLQESLERRVTPLAASLLVALAWGPWHLPMYLRLNSEGARTPVLIAWFLVGIVPLSIVFAWIYHRTGKRLLPVIVFHAAIDAGAGYFFGPVRTGELRPFMTWVGLLVVGAVVVVWRDGWTLGCEAESRVSRPVTTPHIAPRSPSSVA